VQRDVPLVEDDEEREHHGGAPEADPRQERDAADERCSVQLGDEGDPKRPREALLVDEAA